MAPSFGSRRGSRRDSSGGPASPLDLPGLEDVVVVGSGGSATVYRARQSRFDRIVAVKVVHAAVHDDDARRRFEREQSLTGRLTGHPNIARVYQSDVAANGQPYLVMEYYSGGSVADLSRRQGPMSVAKVLAIGVKIGGALAAAHAADVLHRDVKPANILLDAYGEPILADFGIAGLQEPGAQLTSAYTVQYAAPETLETPPEATERSDQYSLGLTLWSALVGGQPWRSVAERALVELPPGTPPELQDVLLRASSTDPLARWASVNELAGALQQVQATIGVPVTELRVVATQVPEAAPDHTVVRPSRTVLRPTTPTTPEAFVRPPSPVGAPGFAAPAFGDVVGTPRPEEGTRVAQRRHAATQVVDAEPGRGRKSLVWAAAAIVGVGLVVGIGLGVGRVLTSSDAKGGPSTASLAAPTDVSATTTGSGNVVSLKWTDPNDPQAWYGILTTPAPNNAAQTIIQPTSGIAPSASHDKTIALPDAGAYCIYVVPMASETGGDLLSANRSAPAAVNGATGCDTSGSN